MEVVVAKALKSSLHRELAFLKSSSPQAFGEEIWCLNSNNGVGGGEDFSVDDLFDFSQDEFQHEYGVVQEEEEEDEEKDALSDSSSQDRSEEDSNSSNSSSGAADSDFIFSGELAVPNDDIADLEWVSHFVDDSLPELSLLYPVRSEQTKTRSEPEPRPGFARTPCFPFEYPVKARTAKRRRANGLAWSFSPLLSRPSSPPSSCSSAFSSTPTLISSAVVAASFFLDVSQPPAKKQKKKAEPQAAAAGGPPQIQRRCSHCQVQKTPQWRTGPLGPKTLCNACGVRFKSGRLFPEYRPACSPTFSSDVHSNSHRKVLEMRKRKETVEPECALIETQSVTQLLD
ncbi:GATA transcription factor 7-like [Senna tora]|uniref:GATA transcription factor n=1 Tax=Senna tora TaxID=362788 RepID=A0A835CGU2_9FABA|nr:GATA transcription factor 7-like [Senna tora]